MKVLDRCERDSKDVLPTSGDRPPSSESLVMELTDGDLSQHIIPDSGLDESVVSVDSAMRQLLNGVAHAHKQGVVHNDIKVEHLLLASPSAASGTSQVGGSRSSSADRQLQLTDFGLSKYVFFRNPSRIGTHAYACPQVQKVEAAWLVA